MKDYLRSLRKIQQMEFAHLWPGHGPAIEEPHSFLQAYLDHRAERDAQILHCLATGTNHIADMVPIMYLELDPRLIPAASISVLAHLIRLVEMGKVWCEGQPKLDAHYT